MMHDLDVGNNTIKEDGQQAIEHLYICKDVVVK
jgi:hypothetical protein